MEGSFVSLLPYELMCLYGVKRDIHKCTNVGSSTCDT